MAEKKPTASEKKAAEEAAVRAAAERRTTERNRLIGVGALLAAVALFVGGYAVGNATQDDSVVGSAGPVAEPDSGPFGGPPRADVPRDVPGPDRRGPDAHGRRGPFGFDFPEGFDFPLPNDFPEGFDFNLPEDFPNGEGFGFSFECTADGDCTFNAPDGFEFPFPNVPGQPPEDRGRSNVPDDRPGFLGVSVSDGPAGVEVVDVFPGSPADQVGVEPGDVIVSVDGTPVASVGELIDVVMDAGSGSRVEVVLDRAGRDIRVEVVLAAPPS